MKKYKNKFEVTDTVKAENKESAIALARNTCKRIYSALEGKYTVKVANVEETDAKCYKVEFEAVETIAENSLEKAKETSLKSCRDIYIFLEGKYTVKVAGIEEIE